MYKKIMVAIDGGETSQRVLNEAENIANSYNASICIVYCINDEGDKQAANELLEKAEMSIDALSIETKMLRAEAEYGSNGISKVISAAAADWNADLVVVGTANRRGMDRFVMGSVAEQIVANVDASVLLVRPQ